MTNNTTISTNDQKRQIQNSKDRKAVLLMGMGLNGISAEGWIPPAKTKIQAEEMIEDVWTLLQSVDAFIIGRVTFQLWEKYWPSRAKDPSSSDFQRKFSTFTDQIQKIVFSTTLKSVNWRNSRVVNDDISTEISRIKKIPGKNIAIVGGAGIAQTFTKLNLIDDYQLYLHPVIFGSGKSLLGVLDNERTLELIDIRRFQSGGIRLHFRSIR
jgi:dihydrofolate reductase